MEVNFTRHAVERILEMEISPYVIEEIVRRPSVVRPSTQRGRESKIATSEAHPDYAVVLDVELTTVITVVFRTYKTYVRQGPVGEEQP